jgi:tRNA threonylcarbamoyladenosine biosynthesis protein TsaE
VGLDQIIEDKTNIVALEWAEKMREMLPEKRMDIRFQYLDNNKRQISIRKYE